MQNGKIVPLWEVQRALILSAEVTQTIILTISEIPDQPRIFAFVTLTPDSKVKLFYLYLFLLYFIMYFCLILLYLKNNLFFSTDYGT